MQVLVVGSIGLDDLETPSGKREGVLGGSVVVGEKLGAWGEVELVGLGAGA